MFWEIVWNILLFISFNRPVSVMGISKIQWKMEGGQGQRPCHSILSQKIPPSPVPNPFVFQPGNLSAAKVSGKRPKKGPNYPPTNASSSDRRCLARSSRSGPLRTNVNCGAVSRILTYQWPVWQVRVGGIFYKRLEQNNKRPTTQLSNWKFPKDLNLSNLLPT